MAEQRTQYCDYVELVSDHPRRWLEFAADHPGDGPAGPYRLEIGHALTTWLTVLDEGERMRRAFHVLRVHMGEESEENGCPDVPRANRP